MNDEATLPTVRTVADVRSLRCDTPAFLSYYPGHVAVLAVRCDAHSYRAVAIAEGAAFRWAQRNCVNLGAQRFGPIGRRRWRVTVALRDGSPIAGRSATDAANTALGGGAYWGGEDCGALVRDFETRDAAERVVRYARAQLRGDASSWVVSLD